MWIHSVNVRLFRNNWRKFWCVFLLHQSIDRFGWKEKRNISRASTFDTNTCLLALNIDWNEQVTLFIRRFQFAAISMPHLVVALFCAFILTKPKRRRRRCIRLIFFYRVQFNILDTISISVGTLASCSRSALRMSMLNHFQVITFVMQVTKLCAIDEYERKKNTHSQNVQRKKHTRDDDDDDDEKERSHISCIRPIVRMCWQRAVRGCRLDIIFFFSLSHLCVLKAILVQTSEANKRMQWQVRSGPFNSSIPSECRSQMG